MKREAKLLLEKACDSLLLSTELFNRPRDCGRVSGTLILLDHAFEMLRKAAILHRGGRIRERRARETIGFDACVRRGLSDGRIKFLTEQALPCRRSTVFAMWRSTTSWMSRRASSTCTSSRASRCSATC
jgi:hypothetical protein